MSCPSAKDIKDHIIMHEILGVGQGSGGTDLTIVNGYPVFNDPQRGNKQLTVTRIPYEATKKGRTKNTTLQVSNGVALTKTGFRMPLAGTICLMSVNNSRTSTYSFHVRKKDSLINLHTVTVVAGQGGHDKLVNIDFSEGDVLEFYLEGLAYDPIARVEIAWRP